MNSSENKNLVLAMVLMLAVWLGFSILFPPAKQTQPPVENATPQSVVSAESQQEPPPAEKKAEAKDPSPALDYESLSVTETTAPARQIVVETDKYQATFTTEGARLVSFLLKEYRDTAAKDAPPVQMYEPGPLRFGTLRTSGSEGFS